MISILSAEREEGRLKNEIKRLTNEINELKERRNMYEVRLLLSWFTANNHYPESRIIDCSVSLRLKAFQNYNFV